MELKLAVLAIAFAAPLAFAQEISPPPGGGGGGGSGCSTAGNNVIQKSNNSGGCANSSVTDNGTTVTTAEDFVAKTVSSLQVANTFQNGLTYTSGTSNPATCTVTFPPTNGSYFYRTDLTAAGSQGPWQFCHATNTWEPIGPFGAGTMILGGNVGFGGPVSIGNEGFVGNTPDISALTVKHTTTDDSGNAVGISNTRVWAPVNNAGAFSAIALDNLFIASLGGANVPFFTGDSADLELIGPGSVTQMQQFNCKTPSLSAGATITTSICLNIANQAGSGITNGYIVKTGNGIADFSQATTFNLPTLITGIPKVTVGTGTVVTALFSDITALWGGTCNGTTFLRGDGACATENFSATSSYFVCTQTGPVTCTSDDPLNGWNGNVTSSSPSDSNNCKTAGTPCKTVAGAIAKFNNTPITSTAIATIYIAKEANTSTDCNTDNNIVLTGPSSGLAPNLESEAAVAGQYPHSYVYILGDSVTHSKVTAAGNGCGITGSFGNSNWITAEGNVALRVRGVQFEGWGKTNTSYSGVIAAEGGAVIYPEDLDYISVASSHNSAAAAFGTGSMMRVGGTINISGTGNHAAFLAAFGAQGFSWGPLATSSANTVFNNSATGINGIWSATQGATFNVDRTTWVNTGNNATILFANLGGSIIYTEAYTAGQCANDAVAGQGSCWNGTNNATGVTYQSLSEGGWADAECIDGIQETCHMTQQVATHTSAIVCGWAREYGLGSGNTPVITAPDTINTGCGIVSQFISGGTTERVVASQDTQYFVGHAALAPMTPTVTSGFGAWWFNSSLGARGWFETRNGNGTDVPIAEAVTNMATGQLVIGSTASGPGGIAPGDLSGDVTTSGSTTTTLATVNSNVGSFTNANITVNAKGLITAASNGSGSGNAGGGFTAYSGTSISLTGTTTDFFPFGGGQTDSTTETDVQSLAPSAANINNFGVKVNTDPGNGNTLVFTVRKNAADTAVTCTITGNGTTNTTCSDTSHTFTTATNDLLDIKLVTGGVTAYAPKTTIIVQVGGLNTGSGTTNTITKWTSSTAIGNGGATDDGTTFAVTDANFRVPTSAGNTPAAAGDIGYDTTQLQPVVFDSGTGAVAGLNRSLSFRNGTTSSTDTLTCSTINTTETAFASTYKIPANMLVANKVIRVTGLIGYTTSASPPTFQGRLRLSTTSQASASNPTGTIVFQSPGATSPSANFAGNNFGYGLQIQGTGVSASSSVYAGTYASASQTPITGQSTIPQPVTAIATNGDLWITLSLTCGANTAGNSVTLLTFNVEAAN